MDPLTAIGGIAAAVQLLGTALQISRSSYEFVVALKHASKDMETLQRGKSF